MSFLRSTLASLALCMGVSAPTTGLALTTGTNLIVNGDAETGVGSLTGDEVLAAPGWTTTGNATVVRYASLSVTGAFPNIGNPGPPVRGKNLFAGGPNNGSSSMTQEVDVNDEADRIDANELDFSLSGYFGGFKADDDNATLTAIFRDAARTTISSTVIGNVRAADRKNGTGLLARSTRANVPPLTRYVTIRLNYNRFGGTYNDGYADNLGFILFDKSTPVFATPLPSQLLNLGDYLSLTSTAGVKDVTCRWQRNAAFIAGATGLNYIVPVVALAHAGAYRVEATNSMGTVFSNTANIGVMDGAARQIVVNESTTMKLTLPISAPAGTLSFRWMRNGLDMADSKTATQVVAGTGTASLAISNCGSGNAATYTCRVTMVNASDALAPLVRTSGDFVVSVLLKPVVTVKPVPSAEIARPFVWQLEASNNPTRFAASGLPTGLVLNPLTGLITGSPTISGGGFSVKVVASNAAGSSPIQPFVLPVSAIQPGLAGTYTGLLDRNATLNASLGGTITVTIAGTGVVTGALRTGVLLYPLTGKVVVPDSGHPAATLNIPRAKTTPLTVTLDFAPDGSATGSLTDGSAISGIVAGLNSWKINNKPTPMAGLYNAVLTPPAAPANDQSAPKGYGYLQMNVNGINGLVVTTGRTGDGAAFTHSGIVWADGKVPLHAFLYSNKGSIRGLPQITVGGVSPTYADNRIGGTLDVQKTGPVSTADRTYKSGFGSFTLTADGSKWAKPAPNTMLFGWPNQPGNQRVEFADGGIETVAQAGQISQTFQLLTNGVGKFNTVTTGNPASVALTLNLANGLFSGSFKLTDPKPVGTGTQLRTILYGGIVVPHLQQGYGWFLLPGLVSTSDILAGNVVMKVPPPL